MACMLSISLSRPLIRAAKKLEINLSKLHPTKRAYHKATLETLRRNCFRAPNVTFKELKIGLEWNQFRNFRTSATLFDQVVVVNAPEFPESVPSGDIRWLKKVGDQVAADEAVGEIETDKTAMPVPAPAAGIVEEFLVQDGTSVKAKQPLFKFKITGGGGGGGAAPAAAAPPQTPIPKIATPSNPAGSSFKFEATAPLQPQPATDRPKATSYEASITVAAIPYATPIETATVKVPPKDPTKEVEGVPRTKPGDDKKPSSNFKKD